MTTTELIRSPRAASPTQPWGDARRDTRPAASANPTFGETLDETLPLIDLVPVHGPPIVLLLGPWLLFALMLAGPFALLFTVVALLVTARALIGLIGAILAAPYLLLRQLLGHGTGHASTRAPAAA